MRIYPFATAIALAACSASTTDDPDGTTGTGLLRADATLRGEAIDTVVDGAWTIRRTRAGTDARSPGAERSGLALREEAEVALSSPPEAAAAAPSGVRHADAGAPPRAGGLRAGSTDDNRDAAAFLAYLETMGQRAEFAGQWQSFDVRDACSVRVVDADGAPRPGLSVQIVDERGDRIAWRGTTLGDGRVPVYPRAAGLDRTCLVEVDVDGERIRQHWDVMANECVIRTPGARADDMAIALDVVFVIDTTGSMGDEIDRVKATLLGVTEKLRSLEREFTLRYGAVLYRDLGDAYVTSAHPFTSDIAAFDAALRLVDASGGGDTPESLNQGLAVAVESMEWRADAAHVAFLIADAPPHMDYEGDVAYPDSLRMAIARGIRIHTVAASGLDEVGSVVFRQIAQATRGEFVFIEYGGDIAASGAAHGVAGVERSNNLDDILFEKLRDEIARFGRADQ